MNTARSKLSLLQSFRGVAAILVVLFHATELARLKLNHNYLGGAFMHGDSGVDFFFVLSGFIILYAHHKDIGRPEKVVDYLKKRLSRIYPIYWIVLAVIMPVFILVPSFGTGQERALPVILKSIFLLPQPITVLGVAWTLSYELLFYIAFALIVAKPRLMIPVAAVWLATILSVFIGVLPYAALIKSVPWLNFLLSKHVLEFAAGCLAAYLVTGYQLRRPSWLIAAGIAGFVTSWMLLSSGFAIDRITAYTVPAFLLVTGAAAMDRQGRLRVGGLLLYLGDASYSIYLVHQTALSAIMKLLTRLHLHGSAALFLATTVALSVAVALGCLVYARVEQPLLLYMRRVLFSSGGRTVSGQAAHPTP